MLSHLDVEFEVDKRQAGCLPRINRNETFFEHMKALNTYLCEHFCVFYTLLREKLFPVLSPIVSCSTEKDLKFQFWRSLLSSHRSGLPQCCGSCWTRVKVHNAAKHIISVELCTLNNQTKVQIFRQLDCHNFTVFTFQP